MRHPLYPYLAATVSVLMILGASACAADKPAAPSKKDDEKKVDPATAAAHVAAYIEYRSLPDLGQIQISTGAVRGDAAAKKLTEQANDFAKRGIFPCVDKEKPHKYHRNETMSGHEIDTTVTILPSNEKKEGADDNADAGPNWICHLVVRIDGHKKFNCSLGDSPTDELTIFGVSIFPEDETVDASASDLDGYDLSLPEESLKFDSKDVITDQTFQEDSGDDNSDTDKMKSAPVKVMNPKPPVSDKKSSVPAARA